SESISAINKTNISPYINDILKTSNDISSVLSANKLNSREINNISRNNSNELYYEILQTKPNSTVWSKFEFLIKPFVDKTSVEESNGIIFTKRKNLTLPNNSSVTNNKSNETETNTTNTSNHKDIVDDNKVLLRSERNASEDVNITDRHFNRPNKASQDSWTQVSTLQSNKDQIDRFKYQSIESENSSNKYLSTKPTEDVNVLTNDNNEFNSLKKHTLDTLYNKHSDPTNAYSNIHATKLGSSYYTTPGSSSVIQPTSFTSLTTISNKPIGSTERYVSSSADQSGNYQSISTKSPHESQKQISNQGVVSTTHKSWIHNKHDIKATNDYYSAIITAADAIKKKHKPVSSTQTVLFPYYDDEFVTPVLVSSTKKPIQLSSTTKRPYASSTKKPFSSVITLTRKPDFEYQTEVQNEEEDEDEENQEEEEAEYEETTTQLTTTKRPYKPLFVSSTAKPVLSKTPYIIRPVINVISQPLTTTKKPMPITYKTTTTTTTTTTLPPATTEKQVTALVATNSETNEDDDDDDDEDDSDSETSEERKRRRKRPHPYIAQAHPYPGLLGISSPAPYIVYQQPIHQNDLDKDESNGSDDDEEDEDDDDFFVNPLDDSDEEDDEIVEETLEVHKSPHGGGHIYDGEYIRLLILWL
ncbi:hypothetical protein WDU94_002078, partial [Cyamophila willieti]